MAPPPKGKRLYLINRDFQLRYTRVAVAVGIVSTAVTLILILYPLVQFQIIRFPNFVPAPFLWAIVAAAFCNVMIVACLGIMMTHRIAGPMFSLVRHIRMVMAGKFEPPLKVRDSDDLKYLVRNYNELVDYLRQLAEKDRSHVDAIVASLRAGEAKSALAAAEDFQSELTLRHGDESRPA